MRTRRGRTGPDAVMGASKDVKNHVVRLFKDNGSAPDTSEDQVCHERRRRRHADTAPRGGVPTILGPFTTCCDVPHLHGQLRILSSGECDDAAVLVAAPHIDDPQLQIVLEERAKPPRLHPSAAIPHLARSRAADLHEGGPERQGNAPLENVVLCRPAHTATSLASEACESAPLAGNAPTLHRTTNERGMTSLFLSLLRDIRVAAKTSSSAPEVSCACITRTERMGCKLLGNL